MVLNPESVIIERITRRRPPFGRAASLFPLLALIALFGVAGGGCQYLAKQPPVADSVDQAFKDGLAKETAAKTALSANRKDDATKLWDETATYYGAVSKKFTGPNSITALRDQARAQEASIDAQGGDGRNYSAAQNTLRSALKETGSEPAVHADVQKEYDDLIARMDVENAKSWQYGIMDRLVRLLGGNTETSPILAILAIAVMVTLITWPLRVRQARSAKELARFQPELKKIQDKYKGEPQVLMQKQQEFNKKHGINQFAGCLPALMQWPIVLLMYQLILHYQFHFRHTTFLWINPATAEAASHLPLPMTLIGHNLGEQDVILLAFYAVSMFVQTKLSPVTSSDPAVVEQQKMMATFMPIMFFVMMLNYNLPSAFVLYWFSSNVLFVAQQWYINRSLPTLPPLVLEGDDSGPAKALAPNPKLVSPKNKQPRRK
jgi:YidC/Oxa1 family membrane protein insertase